MHAYIQPPLLKMQYVPMCMGQYVVQTTLSDFSFIFQNINSELFWAL